MADQPMSKPKKLWRVIFALSLALNVAVVGLVLGFGLRDGSGGAGPRGFDVALGPIGRVLEKEDRRAIADALLRNPDLRAEGRGNQRALMGDFAAVLRAEPFDQDALAAVLSQASGRMQDVQDAARSALVAQIAGMSDAERAALAGRIEDMTKRRQRQ